MMKKYEKIHKLYLKATTSLNEAVLWLLTWCYMAFCTYRFTVHDETIMDGIDFITKFVKLFSKSRFFTQYTAAITPDKLQWFSLVLMLGIIYNEINLVIWIVRKACKLLVKLENKCISKMEKLF